MRAHRCLRLTFLGIMWAKTSAASCLFTLNLGHSFIVTEAKQKQTKKQQQQNVFKKCSNSWTNILDLKIVEHTADVDLG